MNLRQAIHNVIGECRTEGNDTTSELTDAIIAALPGCIPDLKWEDIAATESGYVRYSNGYGIDKGACFGEFYVTIHGHALTDDRGECVWHKDESQAFSAANTHHKQTIMKGLGL